MKSVEEVKIEKLLLDMNVYPAKVKAIVPEIVQIIDLAIEAEREGCAKIAECSGRYIGVGVEKFELVDGRNIAQAIRERGKHGR